jgi:hypothetical protein
VLVPFVGYAQDRRFFGHVENGSGTVVDLLNSVDVIPLKDAYVECFGDDTVTSLGDGKIDRLSLYAVELPRRAATRESVSSERHRLQVQLGPYTALGTLNVATDRPILSDLASSGPMICLGDATIGYAVAGSLKMRDVGTLIVNRGMIDWVRASEEDAIAFPGVTVLTDRS